MYGVMDQMVGDPLSPGATILGGAFVHLFRVHRDGVIIVLGLRFALPGALRRRVLRATSASCRGTSQQNIEFWMFPLLPTLRRRASRAVSAAVSFFPLSRDNVLRVHVLPTWTCSCAAALAGRLLSQKVVVRRLMVGRRAPHSSSHCNELWEGCRVRHDTLGAPHGLTQATEFEILNQSQRVVYRLFLFFSRLPHFIVYPVFAHHRGCARCQGHVVLLCDRWQYRAEVHSSELRQEKT